MLTKKITLPAACVVVAITLIGCTEPELKCISAERPFVVEDQTYNKLVVDVLPRCEERKPVAVIVSFPDDDTVAVPSTPGPVNPGQPDTLGSRHQR
jgi:hypothetical protein